MSERGKRSWAIIIIVLVLFGLLLTWVVEQARGMFNPLPAGQYKLKSIRAEQRVAFIGWKGVSGPTCSFTAFRLWPLFTHGQENIVPLAVSKSGNQQSALIVSLDDKGRRHYSFVLADGLYEPLKEKFDLLRASRLALHLAQYYDPFAQGAEAGIVASAGSGE